MDINNLWSCISHEEATIRSYMRNPEFADFMLQDAIREGDDEEVKKIQRRIEAAKARTYWNDLIGHAKDTANSGYNIGDIISKVSQALEILKAALPTNIQQESRPAMSA